MVLVVSREFKGSASSGELRRVSTIRAVAESVIRFRSSERKCLAICPIGRGVCYSISLIWLALWVNVAADPGDFEREKGGGGCGWSVRPLAGTR